MKCLVIGIDGADKRVFDKFDMKHISEFINKNISLDLKEDVWSRGWAKILSGKTGMQTGAFYAKPRLDGTHLTTSSFSMSDYNKKGCEPIWKKLKEANYTSGFMNVPTTGPATDVNGFMIAGAGGGSSNDGQSLVPHDACFPNKLSNHLNDMNYKLDVRFSRLNEPNHEVFIQELIDMQEVQTKSFLSLVKEFSPDFGFIALTPLVRAQNIYMKHINEIKKDKDYSDDSVEGLLKKLYLNFDECIYEILKNTSAENIIFTSDHGQSAMKYTSNINIWLKENGYAQDKPKKMKSFGNSIKKIAPSFIKRLVSKNTKSLKDYLSPVNTDWRKTDAFALRYIPGIYMNDSRFSGTKSKEHLDKLINKIIEEFNKSYLNYEYGMKAERYRSIYSYAEYQDLLPDIWIHHSEEIFPSASGKKSIQDNPNYKFIDNLKDVTHDMYAGSKGNRPFVVCSNSLKNQCDSLTETDLTAVYSLILSVFNLNN